MATSYSKRIAGFSDAHIYDDSRVQKFRELRAVILDAKPDLLVLNGDILDPWKAPWETIAQTVSYFLVEDLAARISTVYIAQNHDYNPPGYIFPSAARTNQYQSGKWLFMHGWELSFDWGSLGISRLAFWLATHHPGLMIPIHKALFKPHVAASGPHDKRQDWSLTVESGHARARLLAQKTNYNLVIGHYHCPSEFDGLMMDGGDMEDSFTWWLIPDSDKNVVELKRLWT